MKRQLFYVIVAYAAWLTYQDINGALKEASAEAVQPQLRQVVAEQVGDGKKIVAYGQTAKSTECTEQQGCGEQNRTPSRHD